MENRDAEIPCKNGKLEERLTTGESNMTHQTNNTITITGISTALILAAVSLIFTFGVNREKITVLESNYSYIREKVDGIAGKVDKLDGKMDIIMARTKP